MRTIPDFLISKNVFFMKTKIFVTALALGVFFTTASAQTIKQKAHNQRHRIGQGVRSGELTRGETRNLVHGQKEIYHDVRAAREDGIVTNAERKDIKKEQRQESRDIFRKKHNGRDRN